MYTQKYLFYKYLAWLITIVYSSKLGLELWRLSRLLSVYKIASTLNRLYSENIELSEAQIYWASFENFSYTRQN